MGLPFLDWGTKASAWAISMGDSTIIIDKPLIPPMGYIFWDPTNNNLLRLGSCKPCPKVYNFWHGKPAVLMHSIYGGFAKGKRGVSILSRGHF